MNYYSFAMVRFMTVINQYTELNHNILCTLITDILCLGNEKINIERVVDLRAKLMLIANENYEKQREINNFVDMFTSIEKLTHSYVSLLKAGCLLFHNWHAEIW